MAVRGWGGSIATAIGVAAGAGAAQLGLGYGLGIIAWLPTVKGENEAAWVASLAWATWIAATSVVAGAITADRLSGPGGATAGTVGGATAGTVAPTQTAPATDADTVADPLSGSGPMATALWRLALAVAAAIGALVTVALIAIPARAAVRADTFSPQTIAAGYAVVGVIVGLFVAVGALAARAVATNVIATVGWLWTLAIIAVIDSVLSGRGLTTAQLAVWQFTDDSSGYWFRNLYLPGVGLSLVSALVIGVLAGLPAARRGDSRVGIAVSGVIGPLLVAAAYFLAAPRLVGVRAEQLSAYLIAPYAVIAGLAGSVLATRIGSRSTAGRSTHTRTEANTPTGDGWSDTAGGDTDPGRTDLTDDEYAPARAYATDSLTEPASASAESAGGLPSVPEPVWPDEAKPGRGKPRPGRAGRGSRKS